VTGVRRDCTCPRARHQHGTWRAYCNDKCRCDPCRAAWADYTRDRRRRIAQASWTRWPLYTTPHGTARRLRALAVIGYGCNEIALLLGKPSCVVQDWRGQRHAWVYGASAATVAALYDRLWSQPSADRYARKTRNLAARNGWLPPLAWDDDLIDDPDYTPNVETVPIVDEIAVELAMSGRPVHLTREEKREAWRRLEAAGLSARVIGQRLNVSTRSVQRRRAA
jgi:hypothetical protein